MVKMPKRVPKQNNTESRCNRDEEIGKEKRSDATLNSESPIPHSELPYQAFAIVTDRDNPDTWKLPHHTGLILRSIGGKIGCKHTVDWDLIGTAVALLSRQGVDGRRIDATEDKVLAAAKHLAGHYLEAGKPLPDALAVLV